MDEIRIGVAGLGNRASAWFRLLQSVPGYRITAVYDWIEPLQERALGMGFRVCLTAMYVLFLSFFTTA